MEYCLYTTESGEVYAMAQFSSWLVPLFVWASGFSRDVKTGRVGTEFSTGTFSFYLVVWNAVLYILQTALHMQRPDPFCPSMVTNGFPSSAAFYTAVGGTFLILRAWLLTYSIGWGSILKLGVWWIIPPAVLVWFSFNTWQEVLASLCLGALATFAFFLVLRYYVIDLLPYILNQPPANVDGMS